MNRGELVLLGHATQLVSSGWTQHADARDADGNRVDPWDAAAVSWSLLETLTVAYERLLGSAGSSVLALTEAARRHEPPPPHLPMN